MAACRPPRAQLAATSKGGEVALLSLAQAAIYLGTSERHLRRLWQERRVAGIKVGRRVRFTVEDLDAFIERNRVEALR